ncbi:MAG: M20/M25/M40 family metallo-hydrolase [Chloroflexia bacterium]
MRRFRDFARKHLPEVVEDLRSLCALPGMAGRPDELQATAAWVAHALEESGLQVQVLSAGGPPVVLAEREVPGRPTVLFYDHYDVQPPGDEREWRFPPFSPRLYRRRLYARGAVDNKGTLLARLWALRAWQELEGGLPVGVRFLVEGEEEVGSPHLAEFVLAHAEKLRADGCIWESGGVSADGRPHLYLGMKGLLSVELEARGAVTELHSGWATIAPNPAWRLVWALSKLKSPDEEILIDGFYDAVEGPDHEEIRRARRLPFPEKEYLEAWQVPAFLQGMSGSTLLLCQFYSPTCNISGLSGGHVGPGERTIVPSVARARLDFRLVPRQRPEEVLDQLRRYLDREGFTDIQIRPLGSPLMPFRTPLDAPFVRAVVEATRQAFQKRPAVFPIAGGSGPIFLFGQGLGLPVVGLGLAHPGSQVHGANENVRLSDLERGIVHVAVLLARLAEGLPG